MTLRFVSAGAAQGLVKSVAAAERVPVDGHFGAVGAMWGLLQQGTACDIVILTRAQVDKLAAAGEVIAESITDLGGAATSIAVRAGDPSPRVRDSAELRAALLAADAIYFPDPAKATAGVHFDKVLGDLGIREQVAGRVRTFPNGSTAMAQMAQASGHPIGCTQATEILATPGVTLVAPLPAQHALSTLYTAAVHTRAQPVNEASLFVRRLGSDALAEARRTAGFEPMGRTA